MKRRDGPPGGKTKVIGKPGGGCPTGATRWKTDKTEKVKVGKGSPLSIMVEPVTILRVVMLT